MDATRNSLDVVTAAPPADDSFALAVASSFLGRSWRFRPAEPEIARAFELTGMNAVLARLLAARGVTTEGAEDFLSPRLKALLPDPSLLANMDKAARRFADAIVAKETIAVLGDYDVDGGCASALLLRYGRACGVEPILYIPDRLTEGYGPSSGAMRHLHGRGARVVVTVDTGAAAVAALTTARELGLDVIVLDHHAVETNPPAFAHVNPNGPDDSSGLTYICGTAVTFLFLVAVQRELRARDFFTASARPEPDLLSLVDLVGLATITDVVPLIGVNRAFVRQGLRTLDRMARPGLAALAQVASAAPPFTPYHFGFVFGPRINAGGRVGRCDLGARLLASDDVAETLGLAQELDTHNRERQVLEAAILEEAIALGQMQAEQSFIFVSGDGWHPGVVGIVASRLTERFGKPAFVAGFAGGDVARGSARSVKGVDLGAIVRAAQESGLLEAGGGHAMAAGFSLRRDRVAGFLAHLQTSLDPSRPQILEASQLIADALVSPSGATLALMDEIDRASPFGAGNPEPLFLIPDVQVAYADKVGTNHIRLRLSGRDGAMLGAIAFRAADTKLGEGLMRSRGRRIHVAGKLKRDAYNGVERVQLIVDDAAPAGA